MALNLAGLTSTVAPPTHPASVHMNMPDGGTFSVDGALIESLRPQWGELAPTVAGLMTEGWTNIRPTDQPTAGSTGGMRDFLIGDHPTYGQGAVAGSKGQFDPGTSTQRALLAGLGVAGGALLAPAAGGLAGATEAGALGATGTGVGSAAAGGTAATAAGAGAAPIISNFVPGAAGAFNPVTGAALGSGAASTLGGAAAGGTALSRLTGIDSDALSIGGNLLGAGLGYMGADRAGDRLEGLANQYMELGAPSRARFEGSFAPGFKPEDMPGFQQTLDTSWDTALRRLSTTGNPYDNPGGLAEAQKYVVGNVGLPALNEYRRLNAGAGGLASLTAAAPGAATGSIQAEGGKFDALGGALADLTRQRQPTFADYMRSLA